MTGAPHWPVGTARVVADVASQLLGELDALTERSIAETTRLEAGYRDAAVTPDDLYRSARANMDLILRRLAFEAGPPELDGVPSAIGRRRAEQGLALDALLHAFRIDFRVVWEAMVHLARRDHADRLEDFLDGVTRVWSVIDDLSIEVVRAYRDASAEIATRDEAQRRRVVDALLAGRDPGTPIADAARALGLPVEGAFVVVVGPLDPDRVRRIDGLRAAWSAAGDELAGIAAVPRAGVRGVVEALAGRATGGVGVSPAIQRLSDAPAALRLARLAAAAGGGGVVAFEAALLPAVVAAAPEASEAVVTCVLGPVLASPAGQRRRLLATARAFVDGAGTVAGAAAVLGVHRNTVVSRLAALEQLTNRSLRVPRHAAEVVVALDALDAPGRNRELDAER